MKRGLTRLAIRLLAIILSVLAPVAATLSYFPIWRGEGVFSMLSGFTLILIFICIVPLIRLLKYIFKSPSATGMWFILFLTFFLLSRIAEEMVVISLVGYLGNLIGAVLWRIAGGKDEKQS